MEQTLTNTRPTIRRMLRLTVLVSAICYALGSFVLSPIYIKFASDIVYADTWWV